MNHFFLLGNPRSGTSLLRLMINQHPNVLAPPECGFAHWWLDKYQHWSAADLESEKKIDGFLDDLFVSKKISTWKLDRSMLRQQIIDRAPSNYSALVDCIYLSYNKGNARDHSVIVDKNNYYIHHLEDLLNIWPDARFIFQVRDGRDVACSYLDVNKLETSSPFKPKFPTSIDEIAKEWNSNNQRILSFLNGIGKNKFLTIKYEDLILQPRSMLEMICSFLQIPFDEKMLNYYMEENEFLKEPSETLDWKRKTLEKPDPSLVGRYSHRLSKDELETFEGYAGEMLKVFAYVY